MTDDPILQEALKHNEQIGGSRLIFYEGMKLLVPLRDITDAINIMNEDVDLRQDAMKSVRETLKRNLAKVKSRTASQKQADEFAQDLVIWFANEVIEGRQTLQVH